VSLIITSGVQRGLNVGQIFTSNVMTCGTLASVEVANHGH
jgi:hypothetical protein